MNPILKYRGGKSREIPLFAQYIPNDYNTYLEPFFGGGALYFHIEPDHAIVNDINDKLISFYNNVRDDYQAMRIQLDEIQSTYEKNQQLFKALKKQTPENRVENKNEALYYLIRDMYNGKTPSTYMDGVLYYFINKIAYSGMIRFNSSGAYNVPFGRYPNLNTKIITPEHSRLLQQTQIFRLDYADVFAMADDNDFMFLDPPYDCIFNDYGNIDMMNGFDEEQHRRLANDFRNLNCRALMIIGKTQLTEELYGNLIRDEYFKSYAVNIKNRFKADAKHIVVTNYNPY
jgi:DNA adenine methylase